MHMKVIPLNCIQTLFSVTQVNKWLSMLTEHTWESEHEKEKKTLHIASLCKSSANVKPIFAFIGTEDVVM